MLALLAADVILLMHVAFILFVVFGALLVLRWPKIKWVHLMALGWGALIEFTGWICPLTPLENMLRRSAGELGYSEGFVEHYVLALIYPAALTRQLQIALGVGVLVLNSLVYGIYHFRGHR